MAKNQTFSVSLSLLTKNFQKGVKTIQTSLNNLKMHFRNFAAAFGAGLGITEIAQNMIDTAKKLDKAQTVLKNVSNGLDGYAENQEFVIGLSKKYNQELTTLMNNYAKFHSAANMANMSMWEQKYIYEALTRAGTYYALTADEMNGVMLAVNQMISKGKISSEELRRQLGERLPGAMNYAAKAMGVTTAKLDEMISDGAVMAEELLPLLAAELNLVTTSLDVNHIQGAIAKMKNAFTELTSKLNIGSWYKNVINGVGDGINYISEHLKGIQQWILSIASGLGLTTVFNKIRKSFGGFTNALNADIEHAEKNIKSFRATLTALDRQKGVKFDKDHLAVIDKSKYKDNEALLARLTKEQEKYNDAVRTHGELIDISHNKTKKWFANIFSGFGKLLKGFAINAVITALMTGLSLLVTKTIEWIRSLTKVKRAIKDIKEELSDDLNQASENQVTAEALLFKEGEVLTAEEIEKRLKVINKILGRTGKFAFDLTTPLEEVNKALKERIAHEKKILEVQAKQKALAALETTWNNESSGKTVDILKGERADLIKQRDERKLPQNPTKEETNFFNGQTQRYNTDISKIDQLLDLHSEIEALKAEIAQLMISDEYNYDGSGGGDTGITKDYQKIQDEYNNSLRALNDKYKDEFIKEKQYKKAKEDLLRNTLDSIYLLKDVNVSSDAFAKGLRAEYDALMASKIKENKVQKELDKYYKSTLDLAAQLDNNLISQEEYDEALFNLKEETLKNLLTMGELNEEGEALADSFKKLKNSQGLKNLSEIEMPKFDKPDNKPLFTKSASEIYEGNAEYLTNMADSLKKTIDDLKKVTSKLSGTDLENLLSQIKEFETLMKQATEQAATFEQAAAFSKVQEEIKGLKKELGEGIWDNISNIAASAERLTNAWQNVGDVLDDVDTSGWEKFLSIFNAIVQTVDTLVNTWELFNTVLTIGKTLSLAMTGAEQAAMAVEVEKLALYKAQASAQKEMAMAAAISSAAAIPFPANIAAITASAAAVMAAFAAIPAFAHGGIVQGNSTIGDHNIARVNAGEMILNKQQQATLFGMLNGSNSGSIGKNNHVEFKIKGSELIGVLNNYNKKLKG